MLPYCCHLIHFYLTLSLRVMCEVFNVDYGNQSYEFRKGKRLKHSK